jgi:AAHS family 3-hydroxyphenylpropionic acid transporter
MLIALAAETAAPGRQARVVSAVTAGFPFGSALAGAAALGLGWRQIFYAGAIAPLVLAALMALALRESPGFLAAGRGSSARPASRAAYAEVLFTDGRAPTTLLLWAASFTALLTLYLMLNWLPSLMGAKGFGRAGASLVSLLFNLGGGAGVLLLAGLLDRGRRGRLVGAWFVGQAVALGALAVVQPRLALAGVAGFAAGVFVSSAPILLYSLAPSYYAARIRGAGVGASVAVGRIGAIAGPLLAAALLALGVNVEGVLFALLPIVAAAGVATTALVARPAMAD